MQSGFELPIRTPPRNSRERLRSLHRQLRTPILEGRLQPGLRLPPTRVLAAEYAVSRNTAVISSRPATIRAYAGVEDVYARRGAPVAVGPS
jgi:DNA-binding transcriptional MocR family regulator